MSEPRAAAAARSPQTWGLLAEFDTVDSLLSALEKVRDAGYVAFDAFAPFPIHGLDESMGIRMSRLPWLVAGGGAAGAAAGLLLQWWTNGFDYRYLVSAKPFFGLPAAIPITFELTVLLAATGAFLGLMAANRFPELHHPVLPAKSFARATTDGFFIAIEACDPTFESIATREFLKGLGAKQVEELED
ncbi:MAG TPA: DUF3341 domain-containing protein [Thermoanaerobaculaceae bacterium]|nr:DUF3341 domain-containing protein [Thermoanaerobaculaceae bacterium]